MTRGDILCQKRRQQVARDLPPLGVDDADPVTVTIEADTEVCLCRRHFAAQNVQRPGIYRIGVMVGEGAVNLRKQHLVCSLKPADQRFGNRAAGAIAAIPDHRQSGRLGTSRKPVDIGRLDVVFGHAAPVIELGAVAAGLTKDLDVIAEEGQPAHDHLEPVMGWRVVAACHLDGPAAAKFMRREIQHRGGTAADIGHRCAAGHQSLDQRSGQGRR